MSDEISGIDINYLFVLILFFISLVAAWIDRYVGITAFVCSTSVLLLLIWLHREKRKTR